MPYRTLPLHIKHQRLFGLFLLFFLLSGCISLSVPHADKKLSSTTPEQHQQQAKNVQQWSIQGAFSINNGKNTELANYTWQLQNSQNYNIQISSTLNVYSITINNHNNQLSLSQEHHTTLTAVTPEALMQQAIGYSLPVSQLYFWIRGLPAPGPADTHFNDSGHLTQLTQAGWHINYIHYQSIDGIDLPSLIKLDKTPFSIKIAIKSWSLPTHKKTT